MGHTISGILNFPRRIFTTYLNASLYELHKAFSDALKHILDESNFRAPRYLLKPDGGTIDLIKSNESPARTVQSGPAAASWRLCFGRVPGNDPGAGRGGNHHRHVRGP